jgi:hypothetical protein
MAQGSVVCECAEQTQIYRFTKDKNHLREKHADHNRVVSASYHRTSVSESSTILNIQLKQWLSLYPQFSQLIARAFDPNPISIVASYIIR